MWKFGAGRGLLSTKRVSFVDAEGNSCRLSTNKAHFVDEMGLCGCHGLQMPLGTCDGASWEPLCASRGLRWCLSGASAVLANSRGMLWCLSGPAKCLSGASRDPPEAFGRITTQTARLLGRGRTCRRCG